MSPDVPRINENHQSGTDSRNARKYNLTLTLNTKCVMYGTLLRHIFLDKIDPSD